MTTLEKLMYCREWRYNHRKPCVICGKLIAHHSTRCISCSKIGNNNPMWKGDDVKYRAVHEWVKRRKPKPELCEECKLKPPRELANISGKYRRDINDYWWLCKKCHSRFDYSVKVNKNVEN